MNELFVPRPRWLPRILWSGRHWIFEDWNAAASTGVFFLLSTVGLGCAWAVEGFRGGWLIGADISFLLAIFAFGIERVGGRTFARLWTVLKSKYKRLPDLRVKKRGDVFCFTGL